MNIPYRTRRIITKTLTIVLTALLIGALLWGLWALWLGRYVVYTRDQGATVDFGLSVELDEGQPAVPPAEGDAPPIYFNDGENAINVSAELTKLSGYYADTEALKESVSQVKSQMQALPAGTAVMVDVKSIYGSFYYSSSLSTSRSSAIDTAAMDDLIAYLGASPLYAIARIPAFRDYEYGLNHVSDGLAVSSGGYLWIDDDGAYWLNPSSQGTVSYLVQIAKELRALGFDEVVFDEFRFPDTTDLAFTGDRLQALNDAAGMLATACAADRFTVSFVGQDGLTLPEGRSRLYWMNATAASVDSVATQSGLADPDIRLVFLTENHDTRFDAYGVLRPLAAAH